MWNFFRLSRFITGALAAAGLILAFQNCAPLGSVVFKSYNSKTESLDAGTGGGNGGSYDGKPKIYHHLVDNFKCEGMERPESVLIRTGEATWLLIQNTPEKCEVINRVPTPGVVYDAVANQAVLGNKVYVPPKPYHVSADEDPNLDDLATDDGICADTNGKCSLRAAAQQGGVTSHTAPVIIHVPAGTYRLAKTLPLIGSNGQHSLTLRGESAQTTFLDGGEAISILAVGGFGNSTVDIENLTFQNGRARFAGDPQDVSYFGVGYRSSAIIPQRMTSSTSTLRISSCDFARNGEEPAILIDPGSGRFEIRRSRFMDNSNGGIAAYSSNGLLIEDSLFVRNAGSGFSIVNHTNDVIIRRSSFVENDIGVSLLMCENCRIENSTFHRNTNIGVLAQNPSLAVQFQSPAFNVVMSNTTLYENGTSGGGNLALSFASPANHLVLNNSIVARNLGTQPNCVLLPGADYRILATNSIFDDSSCNLLGTGNIFANPRLLALADNGGFTPTLVPDAGSPAIDAGANALCLADDQRGSPRPVDATGRGAPVCDIGAVESPVVIR